MQTRRSRWRQRGGTQILFLICCPVLLGAAALTVDVGSIYIVRQKLQHRVDAAALAAGPELPNQKAAKAECINCASENGLDTSDDRLIIKIMNGQGQAVDGNDNDTAREIEVKATEDVPMTFARIFGYDKWPVGARAVVAMDKEPINVVTKNTTPFAVDKEVYDAVNDVSVVVFPCKATNERQQLWIVPGQLWPDEVKGLLINGSPDSMAVGDHLTANPNTFDYIGAIRSAILKLVQKADDSPEYSDPDNHSPTNPRVLTIPLVKKLDGSPGGWDTHNVEVVGFASFYVLGMEGQNIKGHFVDTGSADGQVDTTKQPSQGDQKGKIVPVHLIE